MTEPLAVTITRDLAAPIEAVWRAWTDAAAVVRWMKCAPDIVLAFDNWRPAVGTRFTSSMSRPGAWAMRGSGEFLLVEPPRLLSYRLDENPEIGAPPTEVRVELTPHRSGTRVVVVHSGLPNESMCRVIEDGWTGSLSMLGRAPG